MPLGERSSLAVVALAVGDALRRHGIRAVLTGGACASLHTRGTYTSRDMDFVVRRWSIEEGFAAGFSEFQREVQRARARRRGRRKNVR